MTRTIVAHDARTVARIINLAERCRCTCTHVTAARAPDTSYHVTLELHGTSDALHVLGKHLDRITAYRWETTP